MSVASDSVGSRDGLDKVRRSSRVPEMVTNEDESDARNGVVGLVKLQAKNSGCGRCQLAAAVDGQPIYVSVMFCDTSYSML